MLDVNALHEIENEFRSKQSFCCDRKKNNEIFELKICIWNLWHQNYFANQCE